jgi:hypothetical protein
MFKSLIQTDSEGIVRNTVLDVEQYNYSLGSFAFPNDPIVIDNDIASISTNRIKIEDNIPVSEIVYIHPYTEQILSGTINGGFQLNEQVYQTPITVDIMNELVVDGATAVSYNPIVGSIGVSGSIGSRAAKFYGTYNNLVTGKGAGLKLPPFNSSNYTHFMVEGFLYVENLPFGYDPILVSRAVDAVGGTTHDSFSIEYSVADRQLFVKFNLMGMTAPGFDSYMNMSPQDAVQVGKWHHFAFSVDSSTDPEVTRVATFFDGNRVDYSELTGYEVSVVYGNVRDSSIPLTVGCGFGGERPYKGWIDGLMISGGNTAAALHGYLPNLSTIPVPPEEKKSAGDYTVYYLSMNGPIGTSLFPCDVPTRTISTASYISNQENRVGVALISRQKSAINGLTLFDGVCYGHAITGASASPCFGSNSGTCMIVTGVDQLHGITRAKRIRSNAAEFTIAYLLGSTGMYGVSGASGDFPKLFSKQWGGNTFSYLATQTNTTELKFVYDTVVVSGRTGNFFIRDYNTNAVYGVQTADIKNLYADVVEYHSVSFKVGASASARILGITGMEALYEAIAYDQEAIVQKIAPRIDNVGILYINNNGRMSKKTMFPEQAYVPYVIQEIQK